MAQIDTVRPVSIFSGGSWTASSGTLNSATSDDNDATYASSGAANTQSMYLNCASHTPPADHERHRIRGRMRAYGNGGAANVIVGSGLPTGGASGTTRTLTTSVAEYEGSWWAGYSVPGFEAVVPGSGAAAFRTWNERRSGADARVTEAYVDIDCRHWPYFTFTPSDTDTRTPTFTRSAVDYDGLTARDWTFRITDLSDNTIWSTTGSGTAPASITVPGGSALANGSYEAKWTIQSTIRNVSGWAGDPFPHTEVEAFTIAIPTFTGWVIDAAEIVRNNATVYDTRTPGFVFNDLDTASLPVTAWSVDVTGPTNWSDSGTGTPPNPVMVGTPLADGTYQAVLEVTTSGGTATATIDFDLEVHAAPSFTPLVIGGPTYTDTNQATLGFDDIDLDGLPVHSWSIVVSLNGETVWSTSGGAGSTPPASVTTGLLPNGLYDVAFTITTNFAAAGITLTTTEHETFGIATPQTVIVTDWSAPRSLPADCADPEDACSFYYRARLVGTVDGQPAVTDWVAEGTITNLVTNPKPLLGSGSVEYRRNLCTNPTFHGGDASAWSHYAGVGGAVTATIENDGGYSGAYYRRLTWTTASTSGGGAYHTDAPGSHTPGRTYAFSGYIRPSATHTFACLVQWYDDALNPIAGSLSSGTPVQCPAGQWTRVSHVVTAPTGGTRAQVRFYVWTGGITVGETIDVDAVLIEQTGQVLPYFDGGTTYDSLLAPSWTGVAGVSASVLTAQTPTGWSASGGETAVLVTDDDGEPCVELIDPVGAGGGYVWVLTNAAAPGVGRWVALGVDVKPLSTDQALRMRLYVRTQQGGTNVDTQYSPAGVGWTAGQWTRQVVSVQQTDTADNVDAIVWPNGTPIPGPQFRVRRAVVVFADTKEEAEALAATPWDGDTLDTTDATHFWEGTPDASLSVRQPLRTFEWTDGEHLLRAMTPDGPVFHSGCGQITWAVSRPFTVANGLAGGRQVSSGAPGGHDITLSLAVDSQASLESLEGVLERPLVLVSPADSDEQWSAPVSASVQVVKVGRIRTLGAQMIGTGPEPEPEPEA